MINRGGDGLETVERAVGHRFANRDLLVTALTHPSAAGVPGTNYERFEFLGDRVLALVVAEMLLEAYPSAPEGELGPRLTALVRAETCADVAAAIGLAEAIRATGIKPGGTRQTSILGDACEALIAALYLDGGLDVARQFINANWRARMLAWSTSDKDAKSTLQEWAQGRGLATPTYAIVGRSGPDHAPRFEVEVSVDTLAPCRGEGRSRREAEQDAATAVLVRQGIWTGGDHAD